MTLEWLPDPLFVKKVLVERTKQGVARSHSGFKSGFVLEKWCIGARIGPGLDVKQMLDQGGFLGSFHGVERAISLIKIPGGPAKYLAGNFSGKVLASENFCGPGWGKIF